MIIFRLPVLPMITAVVQETLCRRANAGIASAGCGSNTFMKRTNMLTHAMKPRPKAFILTGTVDLNCDIPSNLPPYREKPRKRQKKWRHLLPNK